MDEDGLDIFKNVVQVGERFITLELEKLDIHEVNLIIPSIFGVKDSSISMLSLETVCNSCLYREKLRIYVNFENNIDENYSYFSHISTLQHLWDLKIRNLGTLFENMVFDTLKKSWVINIFQNTKSVTSIEFKGLYFKHEIVGNADVQEAMENATNIEHWFFDSILGDKYSFSILSTALMLTLKDMHCSVVDLRNFNIQKIVLESTIHNNEFHIMPNLQAMEVCDAVFSSNIFFSNLHTLRVKNVLECQQITDLILNIGRSFKELIFEDMHLSKDFLLVMLTGCDIIERLVLKNVGGISQDLLGEITSDVGRDISFIYRE